jgi:hypothetical protein
MAFAEIPEEDYPKVILQMLKAEASGLLSKIGIARPGLPVPVPPVVTAEPGQPVTSAPVRRTMKADLCSRPIYSRKAYVGFGQMDEGRWDDFTLRRNRLADAQLSAANWGALNAATMRLHRALTSGELPETVIIGLFEEANPAYFRRAA